MSSIKSYAAKPRRSRRQPLFTVTDEDVSNYLDQNYGPGAWAYDASEDVWVTVDPDHAGPGRGFLVFERDGYWHPVVVPVEALQ